MGVHGGGFQRTCVGIQVLGVQQAVLVGVPHAVLGIMGVGAGRARRGQEKQKPDAIGAVGVAQGFGVQPGAQRIQLGEEVLVPVLAVETVVHRHGGGQLLAVYQRKALRTPGGGLRLQPAGGHRQALAGLGHRCIIPEIAARLVQIDAVQQGGAVHQSHAAVPCQLFVIKGRDRRGTWGGGGVGQFVLMHHRAGGAAGEQQRGQRSGAAAPHSESSG